MALTNSQGKPLTAVSRPWLSTRFRSVVIALLLMVATAVVRLINIDYYPTLFIDESTYVSQAWAVMELGQLSPDYYWYDHLPFGWIQLAGWFILTGALDRHPELVTLAGREFMVVCAMATAALLYLLTKKLLSLMLSKRPLVVELAAVAASVLWILSPLANSYSRFVLLDNIMLPWILGAMLLVLGSTRSLRGVTGAGLCMAVAYLTKEISLLALPVVGYMVWQHFRGTSLFKAANIRFWLSTIAACALFPLIVVLNGDGESFWNGQVLFQLAGRQSTGSFTDPSSQLYNLLFVMWLPLDYWLPLAGLAASLPALLVSRLRGPAVLLLLHVVMLLSGRFFIPMPYIIILLPFCAMLVAGLMAVAYVKLDKLRVGGHRHHLARAGYIALLAVPVAFLLGGGAGDWQDKWNYQTSTQDTLTQIEAVKWMSNNLTPTDSIFVEDQLWLDAVRMGIPRDQIHTGYNFKQEMDDAERRRVNYAILGVYGLRPDQDGDGNPVAALRERSEVVQVLGEDGDYRQIVILRQVSPQG